jgi:hypothetical protein
VRGRRVVDAVTLLDAAILTAAEATTDERRACCCYAQATIERWAGLPPATGDLLAAWRIFAGQSPFSPVTIAAIEAGVVEHAGLVPLMSPEPGRWHLVQGWRGTPLAAGVTGHTFLWRAASTEFGIQVDSVIGAGPRQNDRRWADVVAEFKGGLAVAVLRHP